MTRLISEQTVLRLVGVSQTPKKNKHSLLLMFCTFLVCQQPRSLKRQVTIIQLKLLHNLASESQLSHLQGLFIL